MYLLYNGCMADSLFSILSQKNYDQPPEVVAIKDYVQAEFHEAVEVVVREREILLTAPSAALAGALRMHLYQMQKAAATNKRIVLRIR